jgi:outer membrane protein assembly factor BamB
MRFALVFILLPLSQAVGPPRHDWPQFGRFADYQSFSHVKDDAAAGTTEWMYTAADRVVGSPVVGFGRVWFGSDDGNMYCVNKTTGDLIWKYTLAPTPKCTGNYCEHGLCVCNKVRSTPALDDTGNVYFGSYDFNVYKVDLHGTLVWKVPTQGAIFGPVTMDDDGTLFVGSFDNHVYAISPDGTILWSFNLQAHGDATWVVSGDILVGQSNEGGLCTSWPPSDVPNWPNHTAGGGHCFVYALHKKTGHLLWKHKTGAPGGGGVVADGIYYNGNWNQNITAFIARTGSIKWNFNAKGAVESHPAYHEGVVYASAEDSKTLFAIDATSGKQVWNYSGAGEELNGSPTVTLDTVYVGSNDHFLHAVSRKTGQFKFKFKTCANVFSSAAVDDIGRVYISCNTETGPTSALGSGATYAIDPSAHIGAVSEIVV